MKAAIYRSRGGPEVMEYADVPDPPVGANELLVRAEAISIEGGDLLHRRLFRPKLDAHIVGYVAAGEIVAVGEGVAEFQVGQKVTTFKGDGSHAELRAVRTDHAWVVPDGMSLQAAAAALITFGTASLALFDLGGLRAGQSVLVLGAAGGVGLAAVQLAHKAGARVLGTGSSAQSLAAVRRFGLDQAVNAAEGGVVEQVRALTHGRGVDLVIDPLGGSALQQGVDSLVDGGRCVLVGFMDGAPSTFDASGLVRTRRSVIGCMLGPIMHEPAVRAAISTLLDRVASGELTAPIERVFPLASAAEAHQHAERRGRLGRVIMVP